MIPEDSEREDGREDGVTLTATEWSVSASEKVSTGQYENYEVSAFLSGDIPEGVELDGEGGEELETELNRVHARMMDSVQKAAENRERLPEERDWESGGVE